MKLGSVKGLKPLHGWTERDEQRQNGMSGDGQRVNKKPKELKGRVTGMMMSYFLHARQKEKATTSVFELVQVVKRPRALSESGNRPLIRKSGGAKDEEEEERAENLVRRCQRNSEKLWSTLNLQRLVKT